MQIDEDQLPEEFPYEWCSDWGEDSFGIWMGFIHQGIRQGFRWMPPGSFMMGSPEDEAERRPGEVLHQVTLSKGFWLGETTTTQALWQAVMKQNPSEFKGDEHPVERVSWRDVSEFLNELNGSRPQLQLRLPTEAEWEYACRAETSTPFWFGSNITTEQANYDGNYPYGKGDKGDYREKTLAVKDLPPNGWGLYQMHGNVWEWCSDWFEDYAPEAVTDPGGPVAGTRRVLRGGSWINFGRFVRSAYRNRWEPSYAYYSTGFRLARGH